VDPRQLALVAGVWLVLVSLAGLVITRSWRRLSTRELLVGAGHAALVAVTWLGTSKPFEGRILLTVSQSRGLASADLLALLPGTVGALLLWRAVAHRHRRKNLGDNSPIAT
jgi:hypothetical protein